MKTITVTELEASMILSQWAQHAQYGNCSDLFRLVLGEERGRVAFAVWGDVTGLNYDIDITAALLEVTPC